MNLQVEDASAYPSSCSSRWVMSKMVISICPTCSEIGDIPRHSITEYEDSTRHPPSHLTLTKVRYQSLSDKDITRWIISVPFNDLRRVTQGLFIMISSQNVTIILYICWKHTKSFLMNTQTLNNVYCAPTFPSCLLFPRKSTISCPLSVAVALHDVDSEPISATLSYLNYIIGTFCVTASSSQKIFRSCTGAACFL